MYMYVFLARYSPYDMTYFYTLDQSVAASCEKTDLLTFHCSTSGQRVRLHSARFLYAPRVGSTCRGSPEAPYYVSPESTRTPLPPFLRVAHGGREYPFVQKRLWSASCMPVVSAHCEVTVLTHVKHGLAISPHLSQL